MLNIVATSDTKSVARNVRSALGRSIFVPATTRLFWVPVHLLVFSLGVMVTRWWGALGHSPLLLAPLSLLLGMSFAGLAFVGHETLHGALTHNRLLRRFVGFIGFAPFCVSPRLWIAWHNSVHHSNTNIAGRDPDAYPDWSEYHTSLGARLMVKWGAPRNGKWRGWITLALGFSLQSLQVLLSAKKRGYLAGKNVVFAWLETLLAASFWTLILVGVGFEGFLIVYVLPLLVGNAIVMAHIITNHSLSPLCDKNDALASSLTVSVPKWFEFYSLGFGYHVEHHLFPAMSNRHAPRVQAELQRLVPERYQAMPLARALRLMFSTPRVYGTSSILVDPDSDVTFHTLGPGQPRSPAAPLAVFNPLAGSDSFEGQRPTRGEPSKVRITKPVISAPVPDRSSSIPPPNAA